MRRRRPFSRLAGTWRPAISRPSGDSVIRALRAAGLAVALDGVTLDILPITRFQRIELDYIKISFSPTALVHLKDADCVNALREFPREKIILCHCDKDAARQIGQAFGLNKFQGWVFDQRSAGDRANAMSAVSS